MGRQRSVGMLGGASLGVVVGMLFLTMPGQANAQAFSSDNTRGAPDASATGANATAGGHGSNASGANSTVLGSSATDQGNDGAVVLGSMASVGGVNSIALGMGTTTTGAYTIAEGFGATAGGNGLSGGVNRGGIAIGTGATAGSNPGGTTIAIGNQAVATSSNGDNIAFGTGATANAVDSIAIGAQTTASAQNTIAIGNNGTTVAGMNSVVIGVGSSAASAANTSVVLGSNASASAAGQTVLGYGASTMAVDGVALGSGSQQVRNGLAGGAENFSGASVASTKGSVSVGSAGNERQLTNLAGGTQATDAVNVRQLQAAGTNLAGSLGGGAGFSTTSGAYTLPAFTVAGTNYNDVGSALNAITGGSAVAGAKYFHVNSTGPDATAAAVNSVAIGSSSTAYNSGDFAAGSNTTAGMNGGATTNDTAVGTGATATGGNSLALGTGAAATGNMNSTAIGAGANAAGNLSIAVGTGANTGTVTSGIAFGSNASVTGNGSTAIGGNTTASGIKSVALGDTAQALASGSIVIGRNTVSNSTGDIAIGSYAMSTGVSGVGSAVSIGPGNSATGAGAVTIGAPSVANGTGAFAGGFNSNATADGTTTGGAANGAVAIGNASIADGQGSVALGNTSTTGGAGAIAIGDTAKAAAARGIALGSGSVATNANDVALGANSTTTAAVATTGSTIGGTAYMFAGTTPASTVSVGAPGTERTITNVAAGRLNAASTDAINGSQLYATNSAVTMNATSLSALGSTTAGTLGAGATSNSAGGITGFSSTVAGGSQMTVGGALSALDAATQTQGTGVASALGGGAAVTPNGTVTAPVFMVGAGNYGTVAGALNALQTGAPVQYAMAANPTTPNGYNPSQNVTLVGGAAGPVTLSNVAPGTLSATSTQAVNGSQLFATNQTVAALANSPAGLVQQDPTSRAVMVGVSTNGTTVGFANNAGVARTLTGIASGQVAAGGMQAINGGQLFGTAGSVATALGGGSTVNPDGTLSAPAYAVGGQTYNSIGGALTASNGLAVQYTPSPTGTATNSVDLTKGGALAPVALTGLAAGSLTATSADAVNGSQLFATNMQIANNGGNSAALGSSAVNTLGGGATYNPATGITGFSPTIAGVTQTSVGGALSALDMDAQAQGSGLAAALGGGATVAPSGTVTAPTFTVGTSTYNNVGGAIGALQTGAALQYATAAAPTTPNGLVASQTTTLVGATAGPVTLSNVAPGTLSGTSTQAVNGSQLYATNQSLAALSSGSAGLVQQATPTSPITIGGGTGGATVDVAGTAGPRLVTGLRTGTIDPNSTDAVTGGQLYGTAQSVASALGGGSSIGANGALTAPTYSVQGASYNSVGGAVGAIDGSLTSLNAAVSGGGGIKYFHGNSTLADSTALGLNSVAIGPQAVATNAGDVALGLGSTSSTAVATSGATIAGTSYNFAGATPTSTVSVGAVGMERTITNVAAGRLSGSSTDAVNGSQLYATNQAVNGLSATSAQLGASTAASLGGGAAYDPTSGKLTAPTYTVGQVAYNDVGSAVGALQSGSALQYSTSNAPTIANGFVRSQDVTLVGASAGPVILHNVGAGVAATDAANVGQLPGAFTSPTSNTFAFAQAGGSGAPVTLANVAAGLVSATSTQAVNGSQLYGLAQGTTTALNNLAQGFGQLQQEVTSNDRRASAGTAVALAATGLHYDDRPGKLSVGAATAVYRGQVGVSAGLARTSEDGRWRVNAAASFAPTDNKADVGAVVGASYSFN